MSPDGRRIALMSSSFQSPSTVSIWDSDPEGRVGRLPAVIITRGIQSDDRRIVSVGAEEERCAVLGRRAASAPDVYRHSSHRGGVVFTAAGQIVAGRTGGGLTSGRRRF